MIENDVLMVWVQK